MMAASGLAVEIHGLSKSYGGLVALSRIDLEVRRGEVFGILGRNGAGKTTLVEILEGLRAPDKGDVKVLGFDPVSNLKAIKERIGVQLQRPAFYGKLKVIEVLKQFQNYYSTRADLEQLLTDVALSEKRDSYVKHLSGGQLQRLALALALINDPEIVFLDEPTTGLDPAIRRQLWHIVNQIKRQGKTVLLTTHYIEEAEKLCDRVCIMEAGRIIALDSPSNLTLRVRGRSARITLTTMNPLKLEQVAGIRLVEASLNGGARYVLEAENVGRTIVTLVNHIEALETDLVDMQIVRATLEDAFVELTGEGIR